MPMLLGLMFNPCLVMEHLSLTHKAFLFSAASEIFLNFFQTLANVYSYSCGASCSQFAYENDFSECFGFCFNSAQTITLTRFIWRSLVRSLGLMFIS